MTDPAKICVAQIGAAHGLKGEVRVKAFTEDAAALKDFGLLSDEAGARSFRVKSLRPSKNVFVVKFEGVDTREAAEAAAQRSALCKP